MTITLSPVAVFALRALALVGSVALFEWGVNGVWDLPPWLAPALAGFALIVNVSELRLRLAAREPLVLDLARLVRRLDLWWMLLIPLVGGASLLASKRSTESLRPLVCWLLAYDLVVLSSRGRKTSPSSPYVSYRWRGSSAERAWRGLRGRVR